ncbi:pleckstrin homology domain-containing family M member 1 isoform X2 [Daktulosphaira vitifoliae]|uniref:pleckstrin homology domain-containing family M member 1 isoform X2 n=1 Tax=Daktulosphaira vitifoliae TaxID=58002 RepID=UPI0021A9AB40|nr:pleckstrin homology domain-containing family M member 1 isoform X2 [Daktulosphaira vitifoliae]
MNNLFRSIISNKELKDESNKGSIILHFEERLKEFHSEFIDKDEKVISSNYVADRLLSSDDVDRNTDINFWHCLLVISPNGIVDQINSLKHVTTDVGKCRAWIRTTLNDGVFRSYLMSVAKYRRYIIKFYNKKAIIRDHASFEKIIGLMEGIDAYNFDLTLNSSLLNTWPNGTLLLAGYWTPALKNNPLYNNNPQLAEVADVNDTEEAILINDNNRSEESYASSLSSSYVDSEFIRKPLVLIDEDLGWNLIMKQHASSFIKSNSSNDFNSSNETSKTQTSFVKILVTDSNETEKPSEDESLMNPSDRVEKPENSLNTEVASEIETTQSFNDLLESYNLRIKNSSESPKVDELYKQLTFKKIIEEQQYNSPDTLGEDDDSFIQVSMHPEKLSLEMLKLYLEYLFTPAQESGLNSQDFTCKNCNETIGIDFGNYFKCNFTACYYCVHCFGSEMWPIPSKILLDWDFNNYQVCNSTAKFLSEIQYHPLFNIRSIDKKLYKINKEMTKIKELRWQIYYLYRYLTTCKLCNIENLSKDIWPRIYFYNNIHLYSFADLQEIYTGTLFEFLEQKIASNREHIYNCQICSQRGFICELCQDPKIIYPFDIADNYRCRQCKAVFHRKCYKEAKLCPKCARDKTRSEKKAFDNDNKEPSL